MEAVASERQPLLKRPILLCWLGLTLIHIFWVFLDTYLSDYPEGYFLVGATIWRGPYELLIILSFVLMFGFKYSAKNLCYWFLLACICAISLAMDTLWIGIMNAIEVDKWQSWYTPKPQDSVMVFGLIAAIGLAARLCRKGFSLLLAGHLAILLISTAFLVFAHIIVIGGVGKPSERANIETLKLKITNSYFHEHCKMPGMGCYEGPWKADADYPITLDHDLSRFTYSQFIDTPDEKKVGRNQNDNGLRMGGVHQINEHAETNDVLLHGWNTGWLDVSIIDQPEKYAAYFKNGAQVRLMIDYESAVLNRVQMIMVMRPFMAGFSYVWMLTGLCLLLMHANFRRFRSLS